MVPLLIGHVMSVCPTSISTIFTSEQFHFNSSTCVDVGVVVATYASSTGQSECAQCEVSTLTLIYGEIPYCTHSDLTCVLVGAI
jgi:hypothetical protein